MYKAIEYFDDLQDNCYTYKVGDTYPRAGYEPSPERVKELLSSENKRGRAVIAEVKATKAAKVEEPEAAEKAPKKSSKKKD